MSWCRDHKHVMRKTFQFKIYRKPKVKHLHRLVNLHGKLHNHCIALHKRFAKLKMRDGFEWLRLMDAHDG